METILFLVAGHFIADYPLQGDFLAKAKAQGPLRLWHLFGHSVIHGAVVALITGSPVLGLAETFFHMHIDEGKVRGHISFAQDQALHLLCKLIWFGFVFVGVT